jgi:HSP20 family protein
VPEFPPLKGLRLSVDLGQRIEQAFSELIYEPWGRGIERKAWQPAIDIYETDDAYLIEADLPGVPPDSVAIRVDGERLTICGTRQSVAWLQEGRSIRIERARGEFCRSLHLEHRVDVEHIDKQYEHGILRVRLPKLPPDRPSAGGRE